MSDGTVTPIIVASGTAGTAIAVGAQPAGVAFVPDQAPVASFTTSGTLTTGSSISFDASGSTVAYGTIANYAWDFGDGTSIVNTDTATTDHTYTASDTFTARVTVTSSAGTSTARVFTGQTMSRNGGPSATTTHEVTMAESLSLAPPATVTFADTLDGHDQTSIVAPAFGVTNSNTSGWSVTATSTQFTTGARVRFRPTRSVCNRHRRSPARPHARSPRTRRPIPTRCPQDRPRPPRRSSSTRRRARASGGKPSLRRSGLAIPANTYAGVYVSTWTFTISTGP